MGKILRIVNELSIVEPGSFTVAFDKMKSLITDRRVEVEQKGLEHIEIENFTNFIFTTNHSNAIPLEADDRRYACFEVSDRYKQNNDYFGNFMDTLDNDEAGNHIYQYFLNYPEEEMINLRKIPSTSIRDDNYVKSLKTRT